AHRKAWQPRPAGAARQGERHGTHFCGAPARRACSGGRMTPFELHAPTSIEEAVGLLDAHDPCVRPIAGGTALMLMMKAGVFRPTRLISLRRLDGHCRRIAPGSDGGLVIGSMTPLAVIERSPEVMRRVPVIARTLRRLSNIRIRNVATIGGSLAHGDPHMDLPPLLIALG